MTEAHYRPVFPRAGRVYLPGVGGGHIPAGQHTRSGLTAQLPLLAGPACACAVHLHARRPPPQQRTLPTPTHLVPYLHPTPHHAGSRDVCLDIPLVPTIEPPDYEVVNSASLADRVAKPIAFANR